MVTNEVLYLSCLFIFCKRNGTFDDFVTLLSLMKREYAKLSVVKYDIS